MLKAVGDLNYQLFQVVEKHNESLRLEIQALNNKLLNREVFSMAEIKFEIIKNLGIIGEGTKGWKKEVNVVSWNDRGPKLDIRDWDETHEKMGKGVTLRKDEVIELKNMLSELDLEEIGI